MLAYAFIFIMIKCGKSLNIVVKNQKITKYFVNNVHKHINLKIVLRMITILMKKNGSIISEIFQ